MITITDIIRDEEELFATIRRDGRPVGSIDLIGDFEDMEEENEALIDEASQLGFSGATIDERNQSAVALGKKRAKTLTPEHQKKAAQARWKNHKKLDKK